MLSRMQMQTLMHAQTLTRMQMQTLIYLGLRLLCIGVRAAHSWQATQHLTIGLLTGRGQPVHQSHAAY